MAVAKLKAPFPYFGGKSIIADLVWERFGDVPNYVEPFFGSGAVLLARPLPFDGTETVNDIDGLVCNFWRALQADPDAVAQHANWPVIENDLHARHAWLVGRKDSLQVRLEGDPDYYDAKVAGWWVWGLCCWIGSEWCSGKGPWSVVEADDGSARLMRNDDSDMGIKRRRIHLTRSGMGVNRQLIHLGNAGMGINRKLIHLGNDGRGVHRVDGSDTCEGRSEWLRAIMHRLADRLNRVRVCCGDWSRVCGPTPTICQGMTAVFLDPPYGTGSGRDEAIYRCENLTVATTVRQWAIEHGDDPRFRIALCGYEGEHAMPSDWECVAWKTKGGYGSQANGRGRDNQKWERVWFSPHCIRPSRVSQGVFAFNHNGSD